jgi:hypothetical protein
MVVQFEGQNAIHAGSDVVVRIPPAACHVFSTAEGSPVLSSRAS